jgi:hypothetical protein
VRNVLTTRSVFRYGHRPLRTPASLRLPPADRAPDRAAGRAGARRRRLRSRSPRPGRPRSTAVRGADGLAGPSAGVVGAPVRVARAAAPVAGAAAPVAPVGLALRRSPSGPVRERRR